jgi:hypothetical protein
MTEVCGGLRSASGTQYTSVQNMVAMTSHPRILYPSSDSSDSGSCVTKTALHICVVPLLPDIIYEHMSLGVLMYEH